MTPKSLLAVVSLSSLVAGAGLGAAADRTVLARAPKPVHFVEWITDGLDLDAAQRTKVTAIFEARRPQFLDLVKEMRPKIQAFRDGTTTQLKAVLAPAQQARLDALVREWEKDHEPAPPPPAEAPKPLPSPTMPTPSAAGPGA